MHPHILQVHARPRFPQVGAPYWWGCVVLNKSDDSRRSQTSCSRTFQRFDPSHMIQSHKVTPILRESRRRHERLDAENVVCTSDSKGLYLQPNAVKRANFLRSWSSETRLTFFGGILPPSQIVGTLPRRFALHWLRIHFHLF